LRTSEYTHDRHISILFQITAISGSSEESLTRRINQPVGMKAKILAPTSTIARSNARNRMTSKPMRTRKTMPLRMRNTS
jgi:hypothetical protein